MPRYLLTKLRIEGFRGINNEGQPLELSFKPDSVNSIFAVNGAGKSSVFDALTYAIRDEVPKLEQLLANETPKDYYANRFHSKGAATIQLEFLPDDGTQASIQIVVTRSKAGKRSVTSPSGHANPSGFLQSLREDFALLDYSTFSQFIDDTPLVRGRSFASLLGLSSYAATRRGLEAAAETRTLTSDLRITDLETAVAGAEHNGRTALRNLRFHFEKVVGQSLTDTAKLDEAEDDVRAALAGVELLKPTLRDKKFEDFDFDAIKQEVRAAEGGERRRELEAAIEKIAELEAIEASAPESFEAEQDILKRYVNDRDALLRETEGSSLQQLFAMANTFFESGHWANDLECPLCNSGLESSIQSHVAEKLSQYAGVRAKNDEIKTTLQSSAWFKQLLDLEKTPALGIQDDDKICPLLKSKSDNGSLSESELRLAADRLAKLTSLHSTKLATSREAKSDLEKELPQSLVLLTEQVEYSRQFRTELSAYRTEISKATRLSKKLEMRRRWQDFLVEASGRYAAAEAEMAKRRIQAIDGHYKSMFKTIMGVDDVVPELKRAGTTQDLSVHLRDFHGEHDLSARALLSESYRNALAISVFLGAAAIHPGKPRFVVLDDVTSSFDAGHQYQLMELIRQTLRYPTNSNGLQFIILSHDGLLEKYFDRLSGKDGWHHQRLYGSPPTGAVLGQTQSAERLRIVAENLLAAGQIREAEPLLRQYLEFRLLQIIRKVKIPVPFDFAIRDTNRMVGNCINAIQAATDLHYRAGDLILDAQQKNDLANVHVPALLANWVSHYETASGSSLSAPVLRGVLKSIDAYAECFRWDDASSNPSVRRWYQTLASRA